MNATELEEWIPNVDPKDDFLFTITQTDNEDSRIQTAKVNDAHVTVRPTTVTTDIPAMQPGTCWQCHSVTFQNVDSGSEPGLDVINTTQCAYSSENHLFTDTNIKVSNASQPITQLHDCTTGASPGYSNILLSSSGSHVLSKQLVHSDNGSVAPPHNSTLRPDAPSFCPSSATVCAEDQQVSSVGSLLKPTDTQASQARTTLSAPCTDSSSEQDIWYDCLTDCESDLIRERDSIAQ